MTARKASGIVASVALVSALGFESAGLKRVYGIGQSGERSRQEPVS